MFPTRTVVGLVLVLAGGLLLGGCAQTSQCCSGEASACDQKVCGKDGVLVHIKSGPAQAHALVMGLRMAQLMAETQPVLVYCDVDGIQAVLAGTPAVKVEPMGSSDQILADLLKRGVPVYACPGCMAAAGKTEADLVPGVKMAKKEAFFGFTRGRIVTLDY